MLSVVARMEFYCMIFKRFGHRLWLFTIQGVQIDKLLYMKWCKMFTLVALIHWSVSFLMVRFLDEIISVLESMLVQVVHVLLFEHITLY